MRPLLLTAAALVALLLPTAFLPYGAQARPGEAHGAPARSGGAPGASALRGGAGREARPFGAECRTRVRGGDVVVFCHNPYPGPDRLRLHIECAHWWDLDTDTRPVVAGPAMTVRLAGRCWSRVRDAWVSHQR